MSTQRQKYRSIPQSVHLSCLRQRSWMYACRRGSSGDLTDCAIRFTKFFASSGGKYSRGERDLARRRKRVRVIAQQRRRAARAAFRTQRMSAMTQRCLMPAPDLIVHKKNTPFELVSAQSLFAAPAALRLAVMLTHDVLNSQLPNARPLDSHVPVLSLTARSISHRFPRARFASGFAVYPSRCPA
jgi:hypothetical protein